MLNSETFFKSKKPLNMFKVEQNLCPDMTVHINAGTIIYKNQIINFSEQTSEILTAPRVGTWLCVLSVNTKGEIVYTYGVQSVETKTIPKLPAECFHLCIIELNTKTEYITNDCIYDLRQIFSFAETPDISCACKCSMEDAYLFTEEDRQQVKEFFDKCAELQIEIDKLKLLHAPQKEYKVLTDSGLLYVIRFKDDGTPYFERNKDYEEEFKPDKPIGNTNYKFTLQHNEVYLCNQTDRDFVNININIKSMDNLNKNTLCTLILRCPNTQFYSFNHLPQYTEEEYKVENITLTKEGYIDQFSLNFHNQGIRLLQMKLYNQETKEIIDTAEIKYNVEIIHSDERC